MVKRRNQEKIDFRRRKSNPRSKSEGTTPKRGESNSGKICCIATLARSCREKTKDVQSADERLASEASPAKRKKTNRDGEKENVIARRTRRFLYYDDDEKDQVQVAAKNQAKDDIQKKQNIETNRCSARRAGHLTGLKMPSIDVVVHSPKKSSENTDAVFLHGTPRKMISACEISGKKLSNTPTSRSVTQSEKRRHSSGSDKHKKVDGEKRCRFTGRKLEQRSSSENVTPNRQLLCVGTQDAHLYKEAKHVLHSSIPGDLLCRETEIKQIETFLKHRLVHKKPGSLYISGAPGTGKTACLTHILEKMQKNGLDCNVQFINCMNMSQSHRIFSKITEELTGWDKLTNKEAQKFLEKKFATKGTTPIVLVLDEIDQLESKNQDVLYTMFEWPSLPSSKLILIGIANALDLTDRVLPRLQLRAECKPKLLHFSPYSKDQIVKILTARLSEVDGSSIVDVSAIQFCARKIAAVSGDMRKALDICRRAVEVVESEVKRQQVLKPIEITSSPKKAVVKKVTIAHVSKVISEVYGSRIVSSCGGEQPTIPLQQKLLICTILLMQKESKLREIPVGQLHETYCNICKKRQVSQISQEDCLALCNLLETRGIISMKRAKETRMAKVSLKIDEKEVDHALQDKILLSSILQAGLVNN